MKSVINFLKSLQFIFKPEYWTMNYCYSKQFDDMLNDLMDNHNFQYVDHYTTSLGGRILWIQNHPCASFRPHEHCVDHKIRASRTTIQRAFRKYKKDIEGDKNEVAAYRLENWYNPNASE